MKITRGLKNRKVHMDACGIINWYYVVMMIPSLNALDLMSSLYLSFRRSLILNLVGILM